MIATTGVEDRCDERRQIRAEIRFERFDPVDQRVLDFTGAFAAGVAWTECGEFVEQRGAQPDLRRGGRRLRDDLVRPQQRHAQHDETGQRDQERKLFGDAGAV